MIYNEPLRDWRKWAQELLIQKFGVDKMNEILHSWDDDDELRIQLTELIRRNK